MVVHQSDRKGHDIFLKQKAVAQDKLQCFKNKPTGGCTKHLNIILYHNKMLNVKKNPSIGKCTARICDVNYIPGIVGKSFLYI